MSAQNAIIAVSSSLTMSANFTNINLTDNAAANNPATASATPNATNAVVAPTTADEVIIAPRARQSEIFSRGLNLYGQIFQEQLNDITQRLSPANLKMQNVNNATASSLLDDGDDENLDPLVLKYLALIEMLDGKEAAQKFKKNMRDFRNSVGSGTLTSRNIDSPATATNNNTPPSTENTNTANAATTTTTTANNENTTTTITISSEAKAIFQQIVSGKLDFRAGMISLSQTLELQQADPLVFDLNGDGFNFSSARDGGVDFDLLGNGEKVRTGFIRGDDALLFLDRNGNNLVDDGRELFGDQEGDEHGFAKLSRYDDNNDGIIDENDSVFNDLRLWQDLNGDGICQTTEVRALAQHNIKSIALAYQNQNINDGKGNTIAQTSTFTRNDGSIGNTADVNLGYA